MLTLVPLARSLTATLLLVVWRLEVDAQMS